MHTQEAQLIHHLYDPEQLLFLMVAHIEEVMCRERCRQQQDVFMSSKVRSHLHGKGRVVNFAGGSACGH